jgi:hypothetical protein
MSSLNTLMKAASVKAESVKKFEFLGKIETKKP